MRTEVNGKQLARGARLHQAWLDESGEHRADTELFEDRNAYVTQPYDHNEHYPDDMLLPFDTWLAKVDAVLEECRRHGDNLG